MKYDNFEALPVWRKAVDLYEGLEALLDREDFKCTRGFRDQLDRAALSVSNNIAEGFERGTTSELLQFILKPAFINRGTREIRGKRGTIDIGNPSPYG